jgi:CheY-like chemotaxis protein
MTLQDISPKFSTAGGRRETLSVMAGVADGPSRRRSAERPLSDLPLLRKDPAAGRRPAVDGQRPVALLVTGHVDGPELARRLAPYFEIIPTTNLPAAVAVLADVQLDFLLIDAALSDPEMMELITHARVRHWLRQLPIICYATVKPGTAVSRLAGVVAHDVIVEPVSTDELVARISASLPG